MKLLFYEFKKIFSLKIFVVCFVVFLAVNAAMLYYEESGNITTSQVHNNYNTYNQLVEKYSSIEYDDAVKSIEEENLIGEILRGITSSSLLDSDAAAAMIEQNIMIYSEAYPDEYKKAVSLIDERYDELYYSFVSEIAEKLKYVSNYDTFINQIEQRAQNKLKFSTFSDNSFSKRNILKTPGDFKNLQGVGAEIGNDYFVVQATGFQTTDYFLIVLLIFLCVALFISERDKELFTIVKSARNGYAPTIIAKLSALLISAFVITVLFACVNILTAGLYTGFGNVSRNIQSVSEFMNCSFNITIWQYLLLWTLAKATTMCAIATILAVIFVLVKSNAVNYIISFLFFAVEYALYGYIDTNSPFNYFKYINIFAYLWDNNVIGNYLNLNFFGYPITYSLVFVIVCLIVLIVFNLIAVLLYVKNKEISVGKLIGAASNKLNKFSSLHFNSASIFIAESRKHFLKGITAAFLIFLTLFAYSELSSNVELKYFDPVDNCYAGYMRILSGEVTQEKERYIENEQLYFDNLSEEIEKINESTDLTVQEKEWKTSALSAILKGKGEAFSVVSAQYGYSNETAQEYGISPYLIDENIGEVLLLNTSRDWRYFTITLVAIVILISGIFTYEYKKKMTSILHSSKRGRMTLTVSKIVIALITTLIAYVLIYLPFMVNFIGCYGADILSYPVVFLQSFNGINSTMTILQYIIILSLTRILLFIAAAMLVIMFSVILKNNIITMLVSTVITVIPCLIFINNDAVRLSSLFYSGIWHIAVIVIMILSIITAVITFLIAAQQFSGFRVIKGGKRFGAKN